jgi:hypothetical protein
MTYLSRLISHFSYFPSVLLLLAITFVPIARISATAEEEEATPYFGDWENDKGDTLQITTDTIQVNKEKAVRYDDITEDSDGSFFVLQIKDEPGYFEGKFLRLAFGKDPDRFTMSSYKTLEDALKKQNEVKHIEWSAPAEKEEGATEDGEAESQSDMSDENNPE